MHIHGRPCLSSSQSINGKKVEIAAIHPDFCAAMPLSLMEYAGRLPNSLTSFELPVQCGLTCHGLTCLAITS
jgi:hypothetical protein